MLTFEQINIMKKILIILTGATLVFSCSKKESIESETQTTAVVDSTATNNGAADLAAQEPGLVYADKSSLETNQVANTGAKPALNPAHGEPFHRCDISVGAPIDSAPQQAPVPQVAPQMQTNNNGFLPNNTANAPAPSLPMAPATGPKPANNPAHGQAHHRCDLAVGAPLS